MSPSKKTPNVVEFRRGQQVLLVKGSPEQNALAPSLVRAGLKVVSQHTISNALKCMSKGKYAALICDLNLPGAGDGFTLVTAMRHLHPLAVTMVISDYPALREAVSRLLPQADEVLVTPISPPEVVNLLKNRMANPRRPHLQPREPLASVLDRYSPVVITEWLARVNQTEEISRVPLSDEDRTGHLRVLLHELVERLRTPHVEEGKAKASFAALAHGAARRDQGYSAAMLVSESRILQVCIFKTLRNNLNSVDLTLLLTDVMTIADEVDSQLAQTMQGFSVRADKGRRRPPARAV